MTTRGVWPSAFLQSVSGPAPHKSREYKGMKCYFSDRWLSFRDEGVFLFFLRLSMRTERRALFGKAWHNKLTLNRGFVPEPCLSRRPRVYFLIHNIWLFSAGWTRNRDEWLFFSSFENAILHLSNQFHWRQCFNVCMHAHARCLYRPNTMNLFFQTCQLFQSVSGRRLHLSEISIVGSLFVVSMIMWTDQNTRISILTIIFVASLGFGNLRNAHTSHWRIVV